MPIKAKKSEFKPAPEGTHRAICYSMIDLGTSENTFGSKSRTVTLTWELSDELMAPDENGEQKPWTISKFYTLSLGSSNKKTNLRRMLEAWRGKSFTDAEANEFDITKLLGVPCMLQVIHEEKNGSMKAVISTITNLPKGTEKPKQYNPNFEFSLAPEDFSMEKFKQLSKWHQDEVAKSEEFNALLENTDIDTSEPEEVAEPVGNEVDDLPF